MIIANAIKVAANIANPRPKTVLSADSVGSTFDFVVMFEDDSIDERFDLGKSREVRNDGLHMNNTPLLNVIN
jgi:hypothetical protein